MNITFENGREAEVELRRDRYGFPALVVDGYFVASITFDGRVLLSGLDDDMVPELTLAETTAPNFDSVTETVQEWDFREEQRLN